MVESWAKPAGLLLAWRERATALPAKPSMQYSAVEVVAAPSKPSAFSRCRATGERLEHRSTPAVRISHHLKGLHAAIGVVLMEGDPEAVRHLVGILQLGEEDAGDLAVDLPTGRPAVDDADRDRQGDESWRDARRRGDGWCHPGALGRVARDLDRAQAQVVVLRSETGGVDRVDGIDEAGVTTTYTYDGAARQPETVSVPCDPASTHPSTPCPISGLATTTYTYYSSGSEAGLVASVTDADGVVTEYGYADDRALETMTTYDGATPLVTTFDTVRINDPGWVAPTPEAVEVRTTETPGDAVTTEIYDAEGRIIEARNPPYDGVTHLATTYTYGLDGELSSMTDPAGGVTAYDVARVGDPGWSETPEIAEVRTITGPDGISEITKTDRSGDVVVEQRGDPAVPAELATTRHTYGELGRLASTTDPMGVTTTYTDDVEGRLTEVIDEDGEKTLPQRSAARWRPYHCDTPRHDLPRSVGERPRHAWPLGLPRVAVRGKCRHSTRPSGASVCFARAAYRRDGGRRRGRATDRSCHATAVRLRREDTAEARMRWRR